MIFVDRPDIKQQLRSLCNGLVANWTNVQLSSTGLTEYMVAIYLYIRKIILAFFAVPLEKTEITNGTEKDYSQTIKHFWKNSFWFCNSAYILLAWSNSDSNFVSYLGKVETSFSEYITLTFIRNLTNLLFSVSLAMSRTIFPICYDGPNLFSCQTPKKQKTNLVSQKRISTNLDQIFHIFCIRMHRCKMQTCLTLVVLSIKIESVIQHFLYRILPGPTLKLNVKRHQLMQDCVAALGHL